MRVLYCTDTYPPQVNGVSVVTAISVDGLRERGWDVHVIAPKYPDEASQPSDPNLLSIPSASLPLYPDVRLVAPDYSAVRQTVDRLRPDLVHCTTEFLVGRLGQIAALRAGVPLVTSYHTDFSRYMSKYGVPWLAKPVSRYIARFHKRARRTFTPSKASRADLVALGVPDVLVWGCGVDAERFNPSRRSQKVRVKFNLDGAFTFIYVGRLAAEKGVGVVVEAFRRVSERLGSGAVRLVIAGAGPEEDRLRATAPDGTIFLGFLDRETALPELYASADAFVFASTTETLGLVVLEAMASGLSVIATPAGGVAEHLSDGENGLAYPANDVDACAAAMVRVATDGDLSVKLRAGARRTAEALSWAAELDRLDASYRQL
jgi:phosphatidylinositol alpha 1,6-mannosyltransferase